MSIQEKAIGVFDSGLGGISVLRTLKERMPNENFIYFGDSSFAPYGEKSREEITQRCRKICEFFLQQNVKAIVIACNTATSACVNELRLTYPKLPIIGMEPALKVAADGKENQKILVMATHFTLREKKFEDLMRRYSEHNTIIKLPCPELVSIVEHDELDDPVIVQNQLDAYFSSYDLESIHSIVLGCTHFVFFKEKIQAYVGDHIRIVDGNEGTARHVEDILIHRNERCQSDTQGTIRICNSFHDATIIALSEKLLHR